MLETITQKFITAIQSNMVLEWSFYMGIVYAAWSMLRWRLSQVGRFIKERVVRRIEIRHHDDAYPSFMRMLWDHKQGAFSRLMTMDEATSKPRLFNGDAPIYWWRYNDLLIINKATESKQHSFNNGEYKYEEIHITYFRPWTYDKLLKELVDKYSPRKLQRHGIVTRFNDEGYRSSLKWFHIKPRHTIFGAYKDKMLDDVLHFTQSREKYDRLWVPYRRWYLLHGNPWNGKSSISMSLASKLDRDVYAMNLSTVKDDSALIYLFSRVPEWSIILLEDIDCISASKDRENDKDEKELGVTLSWILNCLDGAYSRNDCITIMTTNHPDMIDPALLRPWRCDVHIDVADPDRETVNEYLSFVYQRDVDIDYSWWYSMAQIQELARLSYDECIKELAKD